MSMAVFEPVCACVTWLDRGAAVVVGGGGWEFGGVEGHHGTALAEIDGVGRDVGLGGGLGVPPVDLEILDLLALQPNQEKDERQVGREAEGEPLRGTRLDGAGSGGCGRGGAGQCGLVDAVGSVGWGDSW